MSYTGQGIKAYDDQALLEHGMFFGVQGIPPLMRPYYQHLCERQKDLDDKERKVLYGNLWELYE